MNYKQTPMSRVSDNALNTEAKHSTADAALSQYQGTDDEMDALQEQAYRRLQALAIHHPDPETRAFARETSALFDQAEELESENEERVGQAHDDLIQAREHNHAVIEIAEEHRREQ